MYNDNPLFVSYGLKYGNYDQDYSDVSMMPLDDYKLINEFWNAIFTKFPDDYGTDQILNEINKSGFHIEEVRDPNKNLRGWVFPNDKERLAFSLKFGV